MAEIKTIYKGESVTLLFTFPEAYNMARLASHKIFVGETEFAGVKDGQTIRLQLKSSDTNRMIGTHRIVCLIDDTTLGLRKPYCGELIIAKTQASGSTTSVSNISDIIIPVVISETAVTVGDILYNYVKGEKGDPFLYSDFTPEQIAELQQPAADAIASVEAVELAVEQAEALRVQAELNRQTNTATAISNAENATTNAVNAAGLANEVANNPDKVVADYWHKWNTTIKAYENTGIKAKGEPGATALVKQVTGTSETDVMSQKAVSDELFLKQLKTDTISQKLYTSIATGVNELADVFLTQTANGSLSSNARNTVRRYSVTAGEKIYLVGSTYCESAFSVYGFSASQSITGAIIQLGTTGTGMITMDTEITVPAGANFMMVTLQDNCSLVLARKNQISKLNTLENQISELNTLKNHIYDIDKNITLGSGYYNIRTALAAMAAVTDDVRYISFNNGTKKVTYKYIGNGTVKDLLFQNWIKVDEDMSILIPIASASGKYINTAGVENNTTGHWRKFSYNANTKYFVEAMVGGYSMATFAFFSEIHDITTGAGFLGFSKRGDADEYIESNLENYAITYTIGVTADIFKSTVKYIYVTTRYSDINSIQSHLYKRFVTEDIALSQNSLIASISEKVELMRTSQIVNVPLPKKATSETLKILYIGSSWMQDNAALVRNVALASGLKVKVGNWYRGSCSYQDILTYWESATEPLTVFEANGTNTSLNNCAVRTAVTSDSWDIVVLANSANNSFDWATYGQYYKDVLRLVKMYAPQATMATYQGWVFQTDMSQSRWNISLEVFMKSVIQSGINVVIPTGMALWSMLSTTYGTDTNIMYRGDQTHLSYGFGRYIAACTNFVALITPVFGVSVLGNSYRCADVVGVGNAGDYTITEQQALDCQLFALSANGNRFEFIDM